MSISPQPTKAIEVFYSYSRRDETLRDELDKHLSSLKRLGLITTWHDREISAGTEWRREIGAHLETAQIILLLVSPDFMASDYCYSFEMKRAMERHERGEACVIPIILRPVYWQKAPFAKLQALPTDAKPITKWQTSDEAFNDIVQGILEAVKDIHAKRKAPLGIEQGRRLSFQNRARFAQFEHGLLNPRYTFSTFIPGKANQLAYAASLAVAGNPGCIYNPLFLYGSLGLGKTHLMQAVGHMGEAAGLKVLYVPSETFTNEIIHAIRFQKKEEFRTKYRQIDMLLVDDIQFIAGKETTEEEFFHIFNTLYKANKQLVLTSDRPPKAISSLQDRLRSRFEWGLLADMQPPEYEHRLAILRSKAESLRFAVSASVIEYIARPECKNVRELEGLLNRVIAYAVLHDAPLSISLAAELLEMMDSAAKMRLTVSDMLEGVCRFYNVDPERMIGKQQEREVVWARQVAMYLMREEIGASLAEIGAELGGRDPMTIMHGWEKVQSEVATNDCVRREIDAVVAAMQKKS